MFIALVIPVSLLLVDPISIDRSPILLISVFSLLLELKPVPVLLVLPVLDLVLLFPVLNSILELLLVSLALLVPDLIPLLLPASVTELDQDSSSSKSYKDSLLILVYY